MADGFLARLDDSTRHELRSLSVRHTWSTGATIFHEGDSADRVVIIESGIAKAVSTSLDGTETVLGLRGPGEVLGELAAIDGGVRSASVVAVDPVTALVMDGGAFRDFLSGHAGATLGLLDVVAGKVRDASRRQAEFGSQNTTSRLAGVLVGLARDHGDEVANGVEISLVTQDDLAAMCGASRESIARGLAAMRSDGLVETGRRVITVIDLERLSDLARR